MQSTIADRCNFGSARPPLGYASSYTAVAIPPTRAAPTTAAGKTMAAPITMTSEVSLPYPLGALHSQIRRYGPACFNIPGKDIDLNTLHIDHWSVGRA